MKVEIGAADLARVIGTLDTVKAYAEKGTETKVFLSRMIPELQGQLDDWANDTTENEIDGQD